MCVKCDEWALYRSGAAFQTFETLTARGERLGFDVDAALRLTGAPGYHTEAVDVEAVWHAQAQHNDLCAEHLDHVDMDAPLVFTLRVEGTECVAYLIDGTHRVARARRDGIAMLAARFIEPLQAKALEIPLDVLQAMDALRVRAGMTLLEARR